MNQGDQMALIEYKDSMIYITTMIILSILFSFSMEWQLSLLYGFIVGSGIYFGGEKAFKTCRSEKK